MEHARGQTQRAIAVAYETLSALGTGSARAVLVLALANLAGYLTASDDVPGACVAAREAIRESQAREPDTAYLAVAIEHLALALALDGHVPYAALLEGYADAAFLRHGFEREFTETATHERLAALLHKYLSPDDIGRLLAAGAAFTPQSAVALALEPPQRSLTEAAAPPPK
ncbi:MAG: hypothetical protein GIX03_04045 [Candidatus Eremiobacteraeota bacterium]|nr:hypothetical protein [Candidatus Eremiobacteraeota bacterium]MBC5802179.1 hypothetical protein [Candidatus Eremiobacteraeota bacterium]MBC5821558.1 hypothetical protein [Candidatus Eremiobacteraeota bacterium]